MVGRERSSPMWFYGYVRFWRWYRWTKWQICCGGSQDRAVIEAMIDKYESEQPDTYRYTPKEQK